MKRRRQSKKKQRFNRALNQESLEGVTIASQVLNDLYGIPKQEALDYLWFTSGEPDYMLIMRLKRALYSFDNNYSRTLDDLEDKISKHERWLEDAKEHPITRKVLDTKLDSDIIINALHAAGAKRTATVGPGEESSIYNLSGWYELETYVLGVAHKVDKYDPNQKLNHLRILLGSIRAVFDEGGIEIAQKYTGDLVAEIRSANVFSNPSMFGTADLLPGLLLKEGVEAVPVIETVDSFKDYYIKLEGRLGVNILNLFSAEDADRLELVRKVANGIETLRAAGIDLRDAYRLVNGTNTVQRLELFEYLCDNSKSFVTYQNLRRVGIKDDEYANFLISHGHLMVNVQAGQATLMDVVGQIAKTPSQIKAAASLLRNAASFALSPDSRAITEIASGYAFADLVIDDYFQAIITGQPNKAKLALLLGYYEPDSAWLSNIRRQIREANDDDFNWDSQVTSLKDLEARLKKLKPTEKKTTDKIETQKQIDWYELMWASLKSQDVPETTLAAVESANQKLTDSLAYRLRNIWKTQTDSLEEFSTDVVELYDTEGFQMVLRSPILFSSYKQMLGSKGSDFGAKIKEISLTQKTNLYRALHRFLIPESPYSPIEIEEVPEAEKIDISKFKSASRVIVWGGQYSSDAKKRIRQSVPNRSVEVYDIFNKKTDVDGLTQSDVIIWVTTSNNHPSYYAVKRHSKTKGIGFYHFSRSGTNALVDFLKGLGT